MKDLIRNLDSNKILDGINYQNFNENYPKISIFLNKYQINYIDSIKNLKIQGGIKFDEYESSLVAKKTG